MQFYTVSLHNNTARISFIFTCRTLQVGLESTTLEHARTVFDKLKDKVRDQPDGDAVIVEAATIAKNAVPRVFFIFDAKTLAAQT
jgi:hypothetical protein